MLVSIIIMNHNYGEFLRAAVDSALAQNYPALEVIVVDDGSNDDSAAIIESYGDRVHAVFKEQNGQCSALNAGFAASHGEVIMPLDSDDVLLETAASRHVECIRGGAVRSCGYMDVVDRQGIPTGRRIPKRFPPAGDYAAATLRHGLDTFQSSFTSGSAWSRRFMEVVMPLPEDFRLGVDGYLTAVDRFFGPVAFIDEPIVRYRRHERNGGPSRLSFEPASLKRRLRVRSRRVQFASHWLDELGIEFDARRLSRVGDWRLQLIEHYLYLAGELESPVPLRKLVTSPFGRIPARTGEALLVSAVLLSIRLSPGPVARRLARSVLSRVYRSNEGESGLSACPGVQ